MKSTDIYDIEMPDEFAEIDDFEFTGMDFSDITDDDPSKLVYLPVHAEIPQDSMVGLVSNSFVITKGTWAEVSKFITDNWERLNGQYNIVDNENGNTLHHFTVAR